MYCNATIDNANWGWAEPRIRAFMDGIPDGVGGRQQWEPPDDRRSELLVATGQVQYVGKALRLNEHGTPVKGPELVVARYLRTAWLWEQIRVQGGAYGAVSRLGQHTGIFSMVSYRDPQIDRTLDVYDRTADYLRNLSLAKDDLERAIVGTIGEIDSYKLPDAQGYTSLFRHLTGRSDEELQRIRDEIFATVPADFHRFGQKLDEAAQNSAVVVLGSQERLDSSLFASQDRNLAVTRVL